MTDKEIANRTTGHWYLTVMSLKPDSGLTPADVESAEGFSKDKVREFSEFRLMKQFCASIMKIDV